MEKKQKVRQGVVKVMPVKGVNAVLVVDGKPEAAVLRVYRPSHPDDSDYFSNTKTGIKEGPSISRALNRMPKPARIPMYNALNEITPKRTIPHHAKKGAGMTRRRDR